MATLDTERFCAYHGGYVRLGDCPIVAASEIVNGQARGSVQGFNIGVEEERDLFDEQPTSERRRVRATLAPEVGSLLQSKVDERSRLVLAGPAGRGKQPLPAVATVAADHAARPVRACPHCCHPLSEAIDDRDVYVIALAGHRAASKTTTVLALMEAVDDQGPSSLGVGAFATTESTREYLRGLDPEPLANFRAAQNTVGTDPGRRPPFEFLATLPATATRRAERDAIVLVQDAAGEDIENRDRRIYIARSLLWADAVLFVYNPQDAPGWPYRVSDRPKQSTLLDGIFEDLDRQLDGNGAARQKPPLTIAVSKADLLDPRPDLRDGARIPHAEIKAALAALDDTAMITAADRWDTVHWRFIAPLPEDGSGQQGVTDLFALLLSLLRG